MRKLAKTIYVLVWILTATTTASAQGTERAVDMGLTPSPVYALWSNINRAVILYARVHSTDADWLGKLEKMAPDKFSDKVPAQVLEQVKRFKLKLTELNKRPAAEAVETLLAGSLPSLLSSDDNRITPSQVYLYSGQVLINIAGDILQESTATTEISPLFEEHHFTGKTPSDVFGMVDLAIRRLDEIALRRTTKGGAQ